MADELPAGTVSLEATIDSPPVNEPAAEPAAEPAPSGAITSDMGRVIAAERNRVRDQYEGQLADRDGQLANLRTELERAHGALREVAPIIKRLQKPDEPQAPSISDDEATAEARDLQLYTGDGKPDLDAARRVISRRRTEVASVARQAAQEAIGPLAQTNAQQASRQNFVAMASKVDGEGKALVDPKDLAELWTQFPPEITSDAKAAEVILDAAIGRTTRTKRRIAAPAREPIVSEAAGGRSGGAYTLSTLEKNVAKAAGMSTKDFEASAKTYVPNAVNVIGD